MGTFSLTKNIDHLYDTKNLWSSMLFVTMKRHPFRAIAEVLGEVSFRLRSGRILIYHGPHLIGRGRTARRAMDNAALRFATPQPARRRRATSLALFPDKSHFILPTPTTGEEQPR